MSKTVTELADKAITGELHDAYGPAKDETERKEHAKKFAYTEKLLGELMRGGGGPKSAPAIKLSEAVHMADFKILFPKVVMSVLQKPKEPVFIGQGLLARTVQVDGAKIMEFPTLGAIRAFELADSQEPPEQDPAFSKNITEIRVRRFGLKLEVSNEVIEESQWDILALYTEQAGNAMLRKKEELIFNEYETRAVTIFNNASATTSLWTKGRASNGTTQNGTFDHEDLLDMMAALGTNGYQPTDVILHPLAWSIWAKDPYLRFQLFHKGGVGQTFGQFTGGAETMNANVYVPFGLNVVVSPFQTLSYNANPNTGVATGGVFNYTSVTVVDRNSSILILQRTPMSIVQFENPVRDIRTLMFHEKYGLAILNGGRSAVVAKNVKIDTNYNPIYTIRQVTAA
jgi:hypothetical protein